MANQGDLSRRAFLGVVAAIPATAALEACGSGDAADGSVLEDGAMAPDTSGTDASGMDASGMDASGMDASGMDASGMDAMDPIVDAYSPDSAFPLDVSDPPDGHPPSAPVCSSDYPRIDLKRDCGAHGDGTTNDTAALQRAAEILQAAHGGELVIPPGVYIVGRQHRKTDPSAPGPYYTEERIFSVRDLNCLKISGYGATLKVASGMKYGSFDPRTGEPSTMRTTSSDTKAQVGRVIDISTSANVWIEGLEVDGNNTHFFLGNEWLDTGRQCIATGLGFSRCTDVTVVDVHTHHHGLDGVTVLYRGGVAPRRMPHTLINVVSEYNGRQGISWIGGWGLECRDCKFNSTGRAVNRGGGLDDGMPLFSRPGAGLDIEPNAGTSERSRDGRFTRCEFANNAGAGMLAAVGDGGYSTFDDCTFVGTTSYSVWVTRPGVRFTNCRFHGTGARAHDGHTDADPTPNPELATQWDGCTFEDVAWTDGRVWRFGGVLYYITPGVQGAAFRNCTFRTHQVRAITASDTTKRETFENCHFIHGHTGLASGSSIASFAGCIIKSCRFSETSEVTAGSRNYTIGIDTVVVRAPDAGGDPTHVDGPRVKWPGNRTGDIPAGTY